MKNTAASLLALAALSAGAFAGEAPPPGPLTLNRAIDSVLAHYPSLDAARA